jgi:hypothetical protein
MRPKSALVFILLCYKEEAQIGPSYCRPGGYKIAKDELTVSDCGLHGTSRDLRRRRVANTLRVERTEERLEGSRFVAWQLYGLVAGGSRERLEVRQLYGPL